MIYQAGKWYFLLLLAAAIVTGLLTDIGGINVFTGETVESKQ